MVIFNSYVKLPQGNRLNPGRLEAKAGFDDIVKEQLGH